MYFIYIYLWKWWSVWIVEVGRSRVVWVLHFDNISTSVEDEKEKFPDLPVQWKGSGYRLLLCTVILILAFSLSFFFFVWCNAEIRDLKNVSENVFLEKYALMHFQERNYWHWEIFCHGDLNARAKFLSTYHSFSAWLNRIHFSLDKASVSLVTKEKSKVWIQLIVTFI